MKESEKTLKHKDPREFLRSERYKKLEKITVKNLGLYSVINWVDCSERQPDDMFGGYIVCLEDNTIRKLYYSNFTSRWCDVVMDDIKEHNPVKYWAELPEPPCL